MLLAVDSGRWWSSQENLESAGQCAPWGGVIYGSAILFLEVLTRMLWTLATRHKDMEKSRKEGREEGREEGRKEGRERILQALMDRGVELPPDILEELNGTRPK